MTTRARSSSFILTASLTAILSGCSQPSAEVEETLRPVRTIVIGKPEADSKEFPGIVEAVQKADLSFRVSGKLIELSVKEGQRVEEGQALAKLDQVDYRIKLKDRETSYEVARADYERAQKLIKTGAIARADLDNLQAKLSTAQAQLDSARQELEYTVLQAPFSGQIARRYVENFEEVSAKQEIFALQDTSALLIKVELPESVVAQSSKVQNDVHFAARFDAVPGEEFALKLQAFSTQANDSTQTYTATFIMPSVKDHRILPGMSAELIAERKLPVEDRLFIPANTVLEDTSGRYVFLVKGAEDGTGLIERREVTVGQLTERGMEVTSGLSLGDQLVTAGMSQMTDGLKVRLQ